MIDASAQVDAFLVRADALLDTRLLKSGFKPGWSLNFNQLEPAHLHIKQPDETELEAFLLRFRPFILDKDPVFISRIYNLCWQAASAGQFKTQLADAYRGWRSTRKVGAFELVVDSETFAPTRVLDLWINGHYFHTDTRKKRELDRLRNAGLGLDRHIFLEHVWATTQYVFYLRNQIRFGRRESLLHI